LQVSVEDILGAFLMELESLVKEFP
jgi:hypothetical protein